MRKLAESEVLSLRELLQMEAHALEKAKLMQPISKDQHVQELIGSGITAGEGRIRGIQQFISENEIFEPGEVR